jgi:membrane-associated phospholipid phosphatase
MQRIYTPGLPRWWDYFGVAIYVTHYFALPATAVLTWRLAPTKLPRLLTSASVTLLLGACIHLALPTVPPWLAAQTGQLPAVHRPIVDILSRISPVIYELGLSNGGGNDVAAMPSMHAAAATLVAAVCWTGPLLVRLTGASYAVLMCVGLVYFGEHYAVDILIGAAVAFCIWGTTPRLISALTARRNRDSPTGHIAGSP